VIVYDVGSQRREHLHCSCTHSFSLWWDLLAINADM